MFFEKGRRKGRFYGFNNQEKDNELYGTEGTAYAFEYRIHDTRLGRFLSVDPLAPEYPWNSTYAFSENRVIDKIELEGAEALWYKVNYDSKTGRPIVKLVSIKASYLDIIMPYHLVVSFNNEEFRYAGSFWNFDEMRHFRAIILEYSNEYFTWLAAEQEKIDLS